MPTNSVSLNGDYATQLAQLQQRQKMAQMLQEQAAAPIEVQSYKGIQAPISNLALLAKALQGFGGAYLGNKAIEGMGQLKADQRDKALAFIKGSAPTAQVVLPGFITPQNFDSSQFNNIRPPRALATAPQNLGPAPTVAPGMGPPAMPSVSAPPMGGPITQPTQGEFTGTSLVPQGANNTPPMTRNITQTELENRYQEAAMSDNERLAAWGQSKLDELDTIKAEQRRLQDTIKAEWGKVQNLGPGDVAYTLDDNGNPRVIASAPEKPINKTTDNIIAVVANKVAAGQTLTPGENKIWNMWAAIQKKKSQSSNSPTSELPAGYFLDK
jgi:hypothetical protein